MEGSVGEATLRERPLVIHGGKRQEKNRNSRFRPGVDYFALSGKSM
jgi:hypothetical protein